MYVKSLMEKLGIDEDVSHIFVHSPYTNMKATGYLKTKGIQTRVVKTGVKNAHPVIVQYDIGANNEPNGHGTVAFKLDKIDQILAEKGLKDNQDAKKLRCILQISNKLVGDAIANLLVIEAILYDLDMSIQQFDEIYHESPSRMYKIKVADRTKFTITEDESKLTYPTALQEEIDLAIAKVQDGKAFVRPSGTEDILRLYCEASTTEQMESLSKELLDIIESKYKNI